MWCLNAFILFIFFIIVNYIFFIETVLVSIDQGQLIGQIYSSRNGSEFLGFLGIPYAKPPIGDLRFEPPQEPDAWTGVRKATSLPPLCIQKEIFISSIFETAPVVGDEDCLYLNIFTPTIKPTKLLPVMVYIHGGGFTTGGADSGIYGPEYIMDNAIVFVFIQYRLNVFGFLSAVDEILPGNYGMKDQVAALKWIKKNIAAFGGDPKAVTIFGQSAGGASVHFHLYSPLSKGLFHRAISQSGTSFAIWAITTPDVARAKAFSYGVLSGCPVYSTVAMVNCLKTVPAEELMLTFLKLFVWHRHPVLPLAVTIEPTNVKNAFLTDYPWNGKLINNVPWIVGFNSAEGGIESLRYLENDGELAITLNEDYQRLFPIIFYYTFWYKKENISEITESLRKFYFENNQIGIKSAKSLTDLFSDAYFVYDCIEAALQYKGKVYLYYFKHVNSKSFDILYGNYSERFGVCHSDDLFSLFRVSFLGLMIPEKNDVSVSHRIIKKWINFAYTGNPNDENELWTPMKSSQLEYLKIETEKDEMEKNFFERRYTFWKHLGVHLLSNTEAKKIIDEL